MLTFAMSSKLQSGLRDIINRSIVLKLILTRNEVNQIKFCLVNRSIRLNSRNYSYN